MGLDMSSGLKIYLARVANEGAIPFSIFSFDNLPAKKKKQLLKESKYALRHGKSYANAKEMHDDILGRR